jgi:hypothetical protein
MTLSDHHVITMKLDWTMLEREKPKIQRRILTKKGEIRARQAIESKKVSEIFEKSGSFEELYKEWKCEVDSIIERNKVQVKANNPRRNIRLLIKKKKSLKKKAKNSNHQKRITIKAALKDIEQEIEKERKEQFGNKISKVVDKLRSSKGINGPNMWDVLRKVKKRKEEPAVSIKSKEGQVLEDPEEIKQRYLEYFGELLKPVEARNEEEREQEEIVEKTFKKVMEKAEEEPTK